jgi:hypothetical protein
MKQADLFGSRIWDGEGLAGRIGEDLGGFWGRDEGVDLAHIRPEMRRSPGEG